MRVQGIAAASQFLMLLVSSGRYRSGTGLGMRIDHFEVPECGLEALFSQWIATIPVRRVGPSCILRRESESIQSSDHMKSARTWMQTSLDNGCAS